MEKTQEASPTDAASIARLEYLTYTRQYPEALDLLGRLLENLRLEGGVEQPGPEAEAEAHVRLASAAAALLTAPEIRLSGADFFNLGRRLVLPSVFAATPFRTGDHVCGAIGGGGPELNLPDAQAILKFLLFYAPDSIWKLDVAGLSSPAVALYMVLEGIAARGFLSQAAHRRREGLFDAAERLCRRVRIGAGEEQELLPTIFTAWMHCSYATRPDKHDLKAHLNRLLRDWMLERGVKEPPVARAPRAQGRPKVLVMLEHFQETHAMYRCYGPAIAGLRERFEVVGMAKPESVDDVPRRLFDRMIEPPAELGDVRSLVGRVVRERPDIIYYPSVGMQPWTILLANLRLARVQAMSPGHPATSRSPVMDYVVLGDSVGDPDRFSEKLLCTPPHSFPFVPYPRALAIPAHVREQPEPLRFSVASRSMKLNAPFLEVCARISERIGRPVEFWFFPNETGLLRSTLEREISAWLPGARVLPRRDYETYIQRLNECDVQLTSFPFGNSNGFVDAVRQGIPVVHLDGPEVHSRTDTSLARKAGLPEWLSAQSVEAYVEAAVRLAGDDALRVALSLSLARTPLDRILATSETAEPHSGLVETLDCVYRHHERLLEDPRRLWSTADLEALDEVPLALS